MNFEIIMSQKANQYHIKTSAKEMMSQIHWSLRADGIDSCILNDRYLIHDGKNYRLIRNNKTRTWIVKEF